MKPVCSATAKTTAAVLTSLMIATVLLLPFCDLMYRCGCRLPWRGADDLCNVHRAGVPHCPWCERWDSPLLSFSFLLVFAGQGATAFFAGRKWQGRFWRSVLAGLGVFLVLAALNGLLFKLLEDYPYYFFR